MSADATLKDICIPNGIQTGPFGSQLHAADYTDDPNGIPVVMPKDIADGKIFDATIARITEDMAQSLSRHRLIVGDIVFGRRGDIGRSALVTELEHGWLCGTGCLRARLDENIAFPPFVIQYLLFDDARDWLNANAVGQTMLNLSAGILSELPVPLPPLPEQRKIAAILSTWDEAIALTGRLIDALKRRKQALMQLLLTGKVRFPEFAGQEWEEKRLGDFLIPTLRKVDKPNSAYEALGIRSHGKGTFTKIVEDPETVDMDHLFEVRTGDLIVNITFAWEGAIAIVGSNDDGKLVSHRFPTYTFDETIVLRDFFRQVMLADDFFFKLSLISPGGAGRNRVMSKKDFLELVIAAPSIQEQDKIARTLGTVDEYTSTVTTYLLSLQTQKRALMQRLLTGQVRVNGG